MLAATLQRLGQQTLRILRLRSGDANNHATLPPATVARQLYREIAAQARCPVFYESYAVPDTPDGRFDMIALHAALVMRRLRTEPTVPATVSQALFDHMFAEFDESLREMGVGDLRVGKVVKAMAQGFFGRLASYGSRLDAGDHQGLKEALRRNVYRQADPDDRAVSALTDYVFSETEWLAERPGTQLLAEGIGFRTPEAI